MSVLTTPAPDLAGLAELAEQLTGTLHLPGSAGYAALATPWNVAAASAPVAVAEVADAADVAAAVGFAAGAGIEVSVQCTGHGALAGDRPVLMVHTGKLDELHVDPSGATRVGAGVQWSAVLAAGAPLGLAGLCGSAPHVGVVGYLTGGGLGPVGRTYGFASDHVTAFDLVTGDGQFRRASASENPALFWALRGGKGTVGIVTAVELDLVPLAELYAGCLYFAAEHVAAVLHAWRDWSATLPEQASTSVAVLRLPPLPDVPPPLAGQVALAFRFAWVGDAEEAARVVAPMLAVAPVVLGGIGPMPYAALGAIHADPVDPMPVHEEARLLTDLPAEAVDVLLAHAGPTSECPQVIVELRRMGGAVAREPEVPSAVCHRDAAYSLLTIGIAVPPLLPAVTAHAAALLTAFGPWSTGARLPNFGASADPTVVARAYDVDTLLRLASLSASYDPHRVLSAGRIVRQAAETVASR